MAEKLGSAVLELSADDTQLKEGLSQAQESTRSSMRGMRALALGAGAAAGGAAVAATGAILKMGADIETAFAEVQTLLPQMSDEAFGQLESDVLDFIKTTNTSAEVAIPALYQAISAGVPADNVVDFLKVASDAAIGGVTDLETAVDGITSVVNAYGAENITAAEAADLMFTAVKLGKTDFEQLSNRLSNVVPVAASLGVGFDEVAASLALMTAQGAPTAVATTQLRQLFVEASKTGTNLSNAIFDLAGKSLPELVKEGATVSGVMQDLRTQLPEQEFRDLFGSIEAGNAALLITGDKAEQMAGNLVQMEESSGATNTAFETMADTTEFKVGQALNFVKTSLGELGNTILPVIVEWVETKVIPAFNALVNWYTNNKGTLNTYWDTFTAGIGVVTTLLGDMVTWFTDNKDVIFNWINNAWELSKPIIEFFWNNSGFGLIFEALKAIATWIIENQETIQAWLAAAWAAVQPVLKLMQPALEAIGTAFVAVSNWMAENPTPVQDWIKKAWNAGKVAFTAIKDAIAAIEAAVDSMKTKWDTLETYFETLWTGVKTKFVDGWNGIVEAVLNPFYAAGAGLTLGWAELEQWFVNMWNNVGQTFTDMWQQITDLLFPEPSYAQQIKDVWGGIADAIKGIFVDGANSAIEVLNQLVGLMNTALKKWNDLSFGVGPFSETVGWGEVQQDLLVGRYQLADAQRAPGS